MGGGATLLRRQIENSGKVRNALFVEDVSANAKGYEFLYRMETAGRGAYEGEERPGAVQHQIQ